MTTGSSLRTEEGTLRQCLERVLPDLSEPGTRILHLSQERAAEATSYPCRLVTVQLSTGREVKLFLKDFSFGPKPERRGMVSRLCHNTAPSVERAERELRVYRDLLSETALGTARYYGSISDEAAGRLTLILEFVNGVRLRFCELEGWIAAARWLGRLQACAARHPERWQACDVLLRHDADFFQARAEGALHAVSHIAPGLAGRVANLVTDYDRLVGFMTGQPRTLVHGSYRTQNILLSAGGRSGNCSLARVCPVDWELAAIGAPLYDLAFLCDGFEPPERDWLWDAYLEAAGDADRSARGREEMRYAVDCFRLHKVLKSLSEARDKIFPQSTVAKLVGQAEGLGRLLAQGAP